MSNTIGVKFYVSSFQKKKKNRMNKITAKVKIILQNNNVTIIKYNVNIYLKEMITYSKKFNIICEVFKLKNEQIRLVK